MQVVKQVHRTREKIRKEREPDNKNTPHVEPACTMCHPSFRTKKGKSRAFTQFPKKTCFVGLWIKTSWAMKEIVP